LNSLIANLKKHKFFSEFFTYKAFVQLRRYLIVGFSTVGFETLVLWILKEYIGINLIVANTMAYTISFIFNFYLNRTWSFSSKSDISYQLKAYGVLFVFNLFASNMIIHLLTNVAGVYYMLSKFISIAMIVSWNFVLYKKIIYKDR
jgi:putative flippase GtrA